ncbi:MAG: UbiA family prenyltransferase [Candidatus Nitrosocaldaceae archaeon]
MDNKYEYSLIKEYNHRKNETVEIVVASMKALLQYAKARWLIFNFPWATFVALMISYDGALDPTIGVLAVSSSYLILLATYTYNDAQDLEVDKVNDPNRPFASGKVTKEHIIRLTWILNIIALVMTFFINIQAFIISSILVILGIAYSHPKTSFKDRFPYKTIVTSIGAMLASFLGGFANDEIALDTLYAGIAFFIICTVLALLGDISDLKGDKANNRRTLPIIIGQINTAKVMYGALSTLMALTAWLYFINEMSIVSTVLSMIVCMLFMLKLSILFKTEDTKKIKSLRPPIRLLSFSFQLVLLLAIFV